MSYLMSSWTLDIHRLQTARSCRSKYRGEGVVSIGERGKGVVEESASYNNNIIIIFSHSPRTVKCAD